MVVTVSAMMTSSSTTGTRIEQELCEMWCDALSGPRDQPGTSCQISERLFQTFLSHAPAVHVDLQLQSKINRNRQLEHIGNRLPCEANSCDQARTRVNQRTVDSRQCARWAQT